MMPVTGDKRQYLHLLLLADPSETMIDRYLDDAEMFVWLHEQQGWSKLYGLAVIDATGEIKNLAVDPNYQGRGVGRKILQDLSNHYRDRFEALLVGTSLPGAGFYEHCGFRYHHTIDNFFPDHYSQPILENGIPCTDRICLRKELR